MPIVAQVGRRSPGVRALIASLYLLLALGAVTMIYPLSLMVATATTGNADWRRLRIIPRYWTNRLEQFRKLVVDKGPIEVIALDYGREQWFAPQDVEAQDFQYLARMDPAVVERIDRDYADFMAGIDPNLKHLYFLTFGDRRYSVLSLRTQYYEWLLREYEGDLEQVNRLYDDTAERWDELGMQRTFMGHWEPRPLGPRHVDWRRFVSSRPHAKQRLRSLDFLVFDALRRTFGSVEALNRAHGTSFTAFKEVRWSKLPDAPWARRIREGILRRAIPLEQIRLRDAARAAFDTFFAADQGRPLAAFTPTVPTEAGPRSAWVRFVRSERCLLEHFDPVDPLRLWQQFVAGRYGRIENLNEAHGSAHAAFDRIPLPTPIVDYAYFERNRGALLSSFLLGNFAMVIDVVLLHGRSLVNTLIFVVLSIVTTLTVNPMAAYALSRHDLRFGRHVLVFLLATMAFPVEMVMIPNFLLVKSFPLGAIVLGGAVLAMFFVARSALRWKLSLPLSVAIGAAAALTAAWTLPPFAARLLGRPDLNVSLLNTFFALVLPGIVNGYWVFLLKGFFDSLPSELYEAGMLDGASERRMFLSITLPLSKPVLAVIALSAFTTAYGAFMFAFLTCQDPGMWTLTVFLYQFQQQYGVPQVMASLVIAAVPTLIVFILCQRVILRGIVVPSFA